MGVAFNFIYGLTFLMGIGLLFILFDQTIQVDFQPTIEGTVPDDSIYKGEIVEANNEWLSYWSYIPIVFFFAILLYWFISGTSGGKND